MSGQSVWHKRWLLRSGQFTKSCTYKDERKGGAAGLTSASCSVPGFIFQLPAMRGTRVGGRLPGSSCRASTSAGKLFSRRSRKVSIEWKMAALTARATPLCTLPLPRPRERVVMRRDDRAVGRLLGGRRALGRAAADDEVRADILCSLPTKY